MSNKSKKVWFDDVRTQEPIHKLFPYKNYDI